MSVRVQGVHVCGFGVFRSVLTLYFDLNINIILINVGYLMKHLNRLFLYLKLTQIQLVYTLISNFITQILMSSLLALVRYRNSCAFSV